MTAQAEAQLAAERAQAADDFDARLAYAERENEVARLKVEFTSGKRY